MACTVDFRNLDEGFGGKTYKRKRSEHTLLGNAVEQDAVDTSMDVDVSAAAPSSKRQAVSSSDNPNKPVFANPTYNGVIAGKVSGRKWKQPRTRRASACKVSIKGTTVEERNRQKEIKKAYKERMTELKDEIKNNKAEKRRRREEGEKRKQENILRSGTKFQKITNPKTLQKLAKSKKKKLLKVLPDDLLRKKN
ncbi:rRNA-processing protein CGR1 [Impatiens glandulifera]|uniref:rRNA-processing protein CGR1 n=1 Tax=Impatiens glandulifera TaxID=253017 RepID=UPI001FB0BB57|nr:rRNA-processing protein CGR1 [Impatiens glandulifera]